MEQGLISGTMVLEGRRWTVALEKILEEIKKLSATERERLIRELEEDRRRDKAREEFEKAAGSWPDFDAEGFVAEVYRRRGKGERPAVEW